jgi:hypothetical protein
MSGSAVPLRIDGIDGFLEMLMIHTHLNGVPSLDIRCVLNGFGMAAVLAVGLVAPLAAWAQAPCLTVPNPSPAAYAGSPDRRFASAYGRFVQRADAGDAAAASAALFMLRNGKALFGSEWSATVGQQARWNALAINAARYRVPVLESGADE